MWTRHSIAYDQLPDYLIVFDVWDKEDKVFLSTPRVEQLIAQQLPIVPILQTVPIQSQTKGKANVDYYKLVQSLLLRQSSFGSMQQEGVYIRVETEKEVVFRCKLRRPTFEAGRKDFGIHDTNNKLRTDPK